MSKFFRALYLPLVLSGLISCLFVITAPVAAGAMVEQVAPHIQAGLNTRIFLDLRDINVVDVLKFLAMEGSLNIVTSKNVQGRSTLLLKDVTIEDTLDIILISNSLAYDVRDEIIYIMTEDEYRELHGESYNDQREIMTRTIKYAKPASVLTALQSVQSAIGKIIIEEETGSLIMIDTPSKLKEMQGILNDLEKRVETQVVSLQYAQADVVESKLRSKLDAKAVGTIMGDTRSNQVVVSAYPERMDEILPIIEALDAQTKAVDIDVRILQITINPKFDYGINWDKTFTHYTGTDGSTPRSISIKNAFPIDSTISGAATTTFGKIVVGDLDVDDFNVTLLGLKQVSKTKVLANPRLTVLNNQEAKINIGDRVPYVVTTTTGTGTNVTVSEEIVFIDVGIQLVVTPTINDDGFVTMNIRPEISSQTGELETPQSAKIPIVNTTFIESSVIVKSGKTVIIGGLRRDDLTVSDKGLPYLMDIPLIGNAFKSRAESTTRSEIVIFLSPKVVDINNDYIDHPIGLKPSHVPSQANASEAFVKLKPNRI